jgi:hypothetical protein
MLVVNKSLTPALPCGNEGWAKPGGPGRGDDPGSDISNGSIPAAKAAAIPDAEHETTFSQLTLLGGAHHQNVAIQSLTGPTSRRKRVFFSVRTVAGETHIILRSRNISGHFGRTLSETEASLRRTIAETQR